VGPNNLHTYTFPSLFGLYETYLGLSVGLYKSDCKNATDTSIELSTSPGAVCMNIRDLTVLGKATGDALESVSHSSVTLVVP